MDDNDDIRARLTEQFAADAVAAHERLALDMILRGQFPSMGWKIGYRVEYDGLVMRHVCFPIPPRLP